MSGVVGVGVAGRRLGLDSRLVVAVAVIGGLTLYALQHRREVRRRRPPRIVAVIVSTSMLAAFSWSYTGYLTATGAATTSVRTSDWMRDHGMNPIVDRLEQYIYNRNGPSSGPVSADQLPGAGHGSIRSTATRPGPSHPGRPVPLVPAPVTSLIDHTLAREGQWTPIGRVVDGSAVEYTSFLRPDPAHTQVVAAGVWLNPRTTRLTYVPGTQDPRGSPWAWGSGVPAAERPGLIAAFNSGFKLKDIPGGVMTEGRNPSPLVAGQASVVIYRDGHVDIGAWDAQIKMSRDIVTVRQNLRLLVDGGRPVEGLRTSTAGEWGKRRWQLQYTNRSGLGVTRDGALVYVAGSNLTTASLATAMAHLGVRRGMELDIHASNPTFNFFTPAHGTADGIIGRKLLPTMTSSADRFIAPDQRDFFAVTINGGAR